MTGFQKQVSKQFRDHFHTSVGSNHRQRKDQFKELPKTSMYKWLATNWMISQNLYIKKMQGNWGTKKITKLQKNPSVRRKIVVLDFVGTKGTAGRKSPPEDVMVSLASFSVDRGEEKTRKFCEDDGVVVFLVKKKMTKIFSL